MDQVIHLPLEQAYNVRELGGYAINPQQSVKWHRFLRGDDISKLTKQDIAYLQAYGVVLVLDLRSASECKAHPDRLVDTSIQYQNIPFMTMDIDDVTVLQQAPIDFHLSDFYLALLREHRIICTLMQTIADAPSGCILFHCAAGKDRTGILSMLLLGLAGVGKADIITNYQMSYVNLQSNPDIQAYTLPKDMDRSCMYSNPEAIEVCIDYLLETYGTIEQYLLHCGVHTQQIQKIKDRLLK